MEQAVATHAMRLGEKLRRGGTGYRSSHRLLPHQRARPLVAAAQRVDGGDLAGGDKRHARARQGGDLGVHDASGRSGYRYSKAGLVTVDLVPLAGSQRALPA